MAQSKLENKGLRQIELDENNIPNDGKEKIISNFKFFSAPFKEEDSLTSSPSNPFSL